MKKHIAILLTVFLIGFLIVFSKPWFIGSTTSNFTPVIFESTSISNFQSELPRFLNSKTITLDSLNINLGNLYQDHPIFYGFNHIVEITNKICKLYPGKELDALHYFSNILMDSTIIKVRDTISNNQLDTLFALYNWADQFKISGKLFNEPKALFYNAVYDFWMLEIVNDLEQLAKINPDIKYNNKFKILLSLCKYNNYTPIIHTPKIDKVFYNLDNSRFQYILGRFYLTFGSIGIILLLSLVIITIISYVILINYIVSRVKKL